MISFKRKISRAKLDVYDLAVKGNCQKYITEETGKSKGTISLHIKELLKDGYLVLVSGSDKVKFYEKGPNGKILDKLLNSDSSVNLQGTRKPPTIKNQTIKVSSDKTKLSGKKPNYQSLDVSPSLEVHSHGVRAKIVKLGDTHFLKEPKKQMRSGVIQLFGSVKLNDGRIFNLKYMESPKKKEEYLYVWVKGIFTKEELENMDLEVVLMGYAQEVFNHVAVNYGWRLGLMEAHKGSKTHYVASSTLTDELASRMPDKELITAGNIHIDDTPPRPDGKPTVETNDPITALKLMTPLEKMLDDVDNLKLSQENRELENTLLRNILDTAVTNQKAIIVILQNQGLIKTKDHKDTEKPVPIEEPIEEVIDGGIPGYG